MKTFLLIGTFLLFMSSCRSAPEELESINEAISIEPPKSVLALELSDFQKLPTHHFSRKSPNTEHPNMNNWMGFLDENTLLIDLTLVGSHDAGAYKRGGGLAICQSDDIATQLDAGVRYFDVRLNYEKDDLRIYHGIISQDLSFNHEVLPQMLTFLKNHPSETLLVVVKNENGERQEQWNTALMRLIDKNIDQFLLDVTPQTTIREARGKIILISRSGMEGFAALMRGVRYNGSEFGTLNAYPMYFSDQFIVPTLFSSAIEEKLNTIFESIRTAQKSSAKESWVITNCNGTSALAYPNAVADRVNPKIRDYLAEHMFFPEGLQPQNSFICVRSGILVLDFSTSPTGKEIIELAIIQSLLNHNSYYRSLYSLNPGYVD